MFLQKGCKSIQTPIRKREYNGSFKPNPPCVETGEYHGCGVSYRLKHKDTACPGMSYHKFVFYEWEDGREYYPRCEIEKPERPKQKEEYQGLTL